MKLYFIDPDFASSRPFLDLSINLNGLISALGIALIGAIIFLGGYALGEHNTRVEARIWQIAYGNTTEAISSCISLQTSLTQFLTTVELDR